MSTYYIYMLQNLNFIRADTDNILYSLLCPILHSRLGLIQKLHKAGATGQASQVMAEQFYSRCAASAIYILFLPP